MRSALHLAYYFIICTKAFLFIEIISVQQSSAISGGEKRDYVIQELVETERNYTEVLSNLLRQFVRPLSSLLRPEDSARIFFGIKQLSEIHVGFHSQLRKARNGAAIAQVFLDWREKFLIYGDYCANLTLAQYTLQEACSRNEIVNQEVVVSFIMQIMKSSN